MISTIIFILVLSVLIVVHEFGHFIMAKRCGVKVEKFSLGFGPKIVSIKKGDTEYRISAIPLGGYVKMAGETAQDTLTGQDWEFLSKPAGQRFKIVANGAFLNYILGFLLFSFVFMLGSPTLTNEVGEVLDGYPAKTAGLMAGDKVVSIDGERVENWDELTGMMHNKLDGDVTLNILRDGRERRLVITPKIKETEDIFGKKSRIALVGIAPSQELVFVKYNPAMAFYKGFLKQIDLTVVTCKALWSLVTGRLSLKESVTGPVGIFLLTTKAAKLGLVYLLHIMAVISTSLAIFNVLPIPVLDGGHLIFLLIEKIRKKPVSEKIQNIATHIGLGLLLLLMVFVFYYDIVRFLGK
ncbi:MAG: RIP metalloprotease RseP [Candidatus Omnitrophota bacterium]